MMTDFLESLLNSEFVQNFVLIIINVLMVLVNLILLPIGMILKAIIPDLDEGLLQVSEYFTIAGTYTGWILDAMLITPIALGAVVTLFTIKLSSAFIMYGLKVALSWKKAIFG